MSGAPRFRLRRPALIATAGVAVLAAGAVAWTLGPGGPVIAAAFADGRAVWRLGTLDLEGVSGAGLGDLRVRRATLSDADGVWAEAENLTLGWAPLSILGGRVTIEETGAARLHILRRPKLTPPRPPGRTLDVDLDALTIARLDIDEAVFGEAASFTLSGAVAARDRRITRATLNAARLDAAGDALTLDYSRADAIALDLKLDSPAGGFFAAALKTQAPVAVAATARGDDARGEGALDARVGRATLAKGAFSWTPDAWRGGADLDLARAPAFRRLADAFGPAIRIEGAGARTEARTFTATATAAHAGVTLSGKLGDDWRPAGETRIVAHADRLQAFVPGVSAGGARFDGAMTVADNVTTFDGALTGAGVTTADIRSSFTGPARVRFTRDLIDIEADARLTAVGGIDVVARLARGGAMRLAGRQDRGAGRFAVRELSIVSPQAEVRATGTLGRGAPGLKGDWRIRRLDAVDPRIGGGAAGAWTLNGATPFIVTLDGAAQRFATTLRPLDQLLGAAPRIDAQFAIVGGGADMRRLTVTAPKLRLGATGRIADGALAVRFESSMQGPVSVGAATFTGVADATGDLNGRIGNPALRAEARLSRLDVAGLAVDAPVVDLAFIPANGGRIGRIEMTGSVAGKPATARALMSADSDAFRLTGLQVVAAGFEARGDAAFTRAGPALDLTFGGDVDRIAAPLAGRIAGVARIAPAADGTPALDARAQLINGRLGDFTFTRLDATASGPLDRIALRTGVRGAAAGEIVAFDAAGVVAQAGEATRITLEGQGVAAGTTVATAGPVEILLGEATRAQGVFRLRNGAARFSFADTRQRLSFEARLDKAPIAPIFAFLSEPATGVADGTLTASGNGALAAEIDMAVTDALFARRARDPVTMTLKGRVRDGAMALHADVRSRNGLDAELDAEAPVAARARPLRIALAGEGRADWRARGPADALWGLVGSLDQAVSGQIDGQGSLRFAVGRLSGSGGLQLTNGRFADKLSGVDLRDVNARISFNDDAARLESFSARDARGGTIAGTGSAQGLRDGRIDLVARDVQLLGRPDARAVASGPLSLRWNGDGATVTGDLSLAEATLAPPHAADSIAELDVIEINRPDTLAPVERPAPRTLPASLDVRVRAPGRVFLRGRGLDSEWALDLRVRGTSDAPRVFGEAELLRGQFTLGGRPFEAVEGRIRFNGRPEEALVNIIAELDASEIVARVTVSGPATDPEIQLSSTPSLPEDEILPQALFGRGSEDLSALEAAQLAASLAELAGQASLNITGAARDLVGLDRLDVRDEAGTGLRVAGGKYLTRDVYLEVARTGIGETETQVEWRVRPRLFLISAFEPNGDRRLSVRWRREY